MQIFVQKNGQQLGPYKLDQVNEYLAQGSLHATDPAWHDGLNNWCPLTEIAGVADPNSPAPPAFDPARFDANSPPPPTGEYAVTTCPQCQSPCSPGMLICQTCGYDLKSGWQVEPPHQPSPPIVNDVAKQKFPIKTLLLFSGGALSLLCVVVLLYWLFVGFGINPVGTYQGKFDADPSGELNDWRITLRKNGTVEHWDDGKKQPDGKWELQGEEVHWTSTFDGNEFTMIFKLYENRLEMIAVQIENTRRNLPDESEGFRGRVFVKTESNKPPASIASNPDDEGEDDGEPNAVDISSPSEDDLRVFRELEKVAASINPDLPKTMGVLRLVKVEAKLPREIHYYYEAPSNWKPNSNAESQLRESYRSSPQNEAFRRERVTKVWHYRDSFNNKIAVFRAGPNN